MKSTSVPWVEQMPSDPPSPVLLSPIFKWVFLAVLGLTLLSLGLDVYLVTNLNPGETVTDEMKRLIETCSTAFKLGFGAIVGLIGGKALP